MPRKGSARDDARRRAMQAKAARDQARKLREDQIAAVLADYYLATSQAARLRDQARHKADQVIADGERSAQAPDAQAAAAVRALRDLLGGAAEVAGLCGLTQAAVRDLLAAPAATRPRSPARAAGDSGPGSRAADGQQARSGMPGGPESASASVGGLPVGSGRPVSPVPAGRDGGQPRPGAPLTPASPGPGSVQQPGTPALGPQDPAARPAGQHLAGGDHDGQ